MICSSIKNFVTGYYWLLYVVNVDNASVSCCFPSTRDFIASKMDEYWWFSHFCGTQFITIYLLCWPWWLMIILCFVAADRESFRELAGAIPTSRNWPCLCEKCGLLINREFRRTRVEWRRSSCTCGCCWLSDMGGMYGWRNWWMSVSALKSIEKHYSMYPARYRIWYYPVWVFYSLTLFM